MSTLQNNNQILSSPTQKRGLNLSLKDKEITIIVNNQFYADQIDSGSVTSQINEAILELTRKEKDTIFKLCVKYQFDSEMNHLSKLDYSFNAFISSDSSSLCIIIPEDMNFEELNKETLQAFILLTIKSSHKNLSILLNRYNKEYFFFLKGLLVVGFKPSIKELENYKSTEFKILTMTIDQSSRFDEVQELHF